MDSIDIPTIFIWFIFYSFLGWAWECAIVSRRQKRFVNRGFFNGPYCPIWGTGALLCILTAGYLPNLAVRFIVDGIGACILEYFTGWALEKIFHARWWDYTPRHFNLNGRVCLEGFLVFGVVSIIVPAIHPSIAATTARLSPTVINSVFSILLIIYITDAIFTLRSLIKFDHILGEYQRVIDRRQADFVEFVRLSRRAFELRINEKRHTGDTLNLQQRRMLNAFPQLDVKDNNEALDGIRKIYAKDSRKTSRAARKKARKKAAKIARSKRPR